MDASRPRPRSFRAAVPQGKGSRDTPWPAHQCINVHQPRDLTFHVSCSRSHQHPPLPYPCRATELQFCAQYIFLKRGDARMYAKDIEEKAIHQCHLHDSRYLQQQTVYVKKG